jgi:RNA polymerase sigma-70 factor (ECF subfamily)
MIDIASLSDENLVRRSADGDEEAFSALYRRRQAGIYRFALNMCGSAAIAEEVTQEVFLALIRDTGRYNPERGSVTGYLFGVARKQVLKHLERDRPFVTIEDDAGPGMIAAGNPLSDFTKREAIETVRQAVLSLPPAFREVIVLIDLEETAYADAAQALGLPVGTVRSRLSRARTMLLSKLTRCFA